MDGGAWRPTVHGVAEKRLSTHAQDAPLGGAGGTLTSVRRGEGLRTVTAMWTGLMEPCPPGPSPRPAGHLTSPRGKDPDFAFGSLSFAGRRESRCGDCFPRAVEGIWGSTMPSLGAAQAPGGTRSRNLPQDWASRREGATRAGWLKHQVSFL